MSWSINVPGGADVEQSVADWEESYVEQFGPVLPEVKQQIEAALAASKLIYESGCVGEGVVSLSLSGHANEGHEPREGWAYDMLTVNVLRAAPVPEPE
jgi:hypothetical protein